MSVGWESALIGLVNRQRRRRRHSQTLLYPTRPPPSTDARSNIELHWFVRTPYRIAGRTPNSLQFVSPIIRIIIDKGPPSNPPTTIYPQRVAMIVDYLHSMIAVIFTVN